MQPLSSQLTKTHDDMQLKTIASCNNHIEIIERSRTNFHHFAEVTEMIGGWPERAYRSQIADFSDFGDSVAEIELGIVNWSDGVGLFGEL